MGALLHVEAAARNLQIAARREVHDDDEGYPVEVGEVVEERLEAMQAPGRGADAHDGERLLAARRSSELPVAICLGGGHLKSYASGGRSADP